MSARPALLFYCQHSLGMGHLVRSLALARALASHYDVAFLNGGRFPPGVAEPAGVDVVQLSPLGMDERGKLVSLDPALTLEEAFEWRTARILATAREHPPAAVVVELFPFGRKKFAREIVPLLDAARATPKPPVVVCSLRDILVGGRDDQQAFDDRAAQTLERYFDAVLVHCDPEFARIDESFRPSAPLRVPVRYTGFVTAAPATGTTGPRARRVLVSAGGGIVGGPLLRAALGAQRLLWPSQRLPMTLVAGPFLPEPEWRALQTQAAGMEGVTLVRSVPDLAAEMRRVAYSVSQCGYNTAMDILASGTRALVVPFARDGEDEQRNRAARLARRGLVRTLDPELLDAHTLAQALVELTQFVPADAGLALDGAARTCELIRALRPRSRAGAMLEACAP